MDGLDTSDPEVKQAIDGLKEIWEEFDANKNGYLSKEEFRPMHQKFKEMFRSKFLDLDCDDFEAVFKFFDAKGNNRIEKREMLDKIVEAQKNKKILRKIDAMWEKYDTNKNNFLEMEEFKAFHEDTKEEIQKLFPDLDCDDFVDFFNFFDKNGNGKVQKTEMLAVLK